MGVGDRQQIQNPLHPPVFSEGTVKCVEHGVGARIEGVGDSADVASDIDGAHVVPGLLERRRHGPTADQRDLALARPSAHEHRYGI